MCMQSVMHLLPLCHTHLLLPKRLIPHHCCTGGHVPLFILFHTHLTLILATWCEDCEGDGSEPITRHAHILTHNWWKDTALFQNLLKIQFPDFFLTVVKQHYASHKTLFTIMDKRQHAHKDTLCEDRSRFCVTKPSTWKSSMSLKKRGNAFAAGGSGRLNK